MNNFIFPLIKRSKAIRNTHGTVTVVHGDSDARDSNDDVVILDESLIATEIIRLEQEHDAQEYARKRRVEYPDWGSQLNKIYDDGVTKWKSEMVDPVKAKWPKDNSGPV